MAFYLLASVWCLLLLGGALAPWLGSEAARVGSSVACAALLAWARPRGREHAGPFSIFLVGASGFAALPAWLAFVWIAGSGLGLPPPRASPGPHAPATWLANVVLAPLFEELLYRERLLPTLRARVGAPLAVLMSSAAFAAPHLEPWTVLTTFGVGLLLGAVFLATGRVELCVAHHAALNVAALACGLPPSRAALPPLAALAVASGLLALGIGIARTADHGAQTNGHARDAAVRADAPSRA
jgi:membrane protease YdiL (CAAX protease family)